MLDFSISQPQLCCLDVHQKQYGVMNTKLKTRQKNFTAKIKVTNQDKVKVRFNEPWIEIIKQNEKKLQSVIMSCPSNRSTVKSINQNNINNFK